VGAFLLDTNVLIALAWPEHVSHEKVGRWFVRHSPAGWATCPFTQAAFVRVLSNPAFSVDSLSPENALSVLESNLVLPGHRFWTDTISVPEALRSIDGRIKGHQQITDAYLVGLAIRHRGKLATLDKGIGAWTGGTGVELIA
jgi:toxin-antitoxin system PIN domain toxin